MRAGRPILPCCPESTLVFRGLIHEFDPGFCYGQDFVGAVEGDSVGAGGTSVCKASTEVVNLTDFVVLLHAQSDSRHIHLRLVEVHGLESCRCFDHQLRDKMQVTVFLPGDEEVK